MPALNNDYSPEVRRVHFWDWLILFLYVSYILNTSNLDDKFDSRVYLDVSPLLYASTPTVNPIYDFPWYKALQYRNTFLSNYLRKAVCYDGINKHYVRIQNFLFSWKK